jgi:hypothetical protein
VGIKSRFYAGRDSVNNWIYVFNAKFSRNDIFPGLADFIKLAADFNVVNELAINYDCREFDWETRMRPGTDCVSHVRAGPGACRMRSNFTLNLPISIGAN